MASIRRERNKAVINGALIALGAMAVLDNVIAHWILELHRAVPGPHALEIEVGLVIIGTILLMTGIWRERAARRSSARL